MKNADGGHAPLFSITALLTALFTISTSVLIFLVVGVLYQAFTRHMDEEHEHLLAEIVRVLKHSSTTHERNVTSIVNRLRSIEESDPASDPYELRVVDRQGRVVAESRGMTMIPVVAFQGIPAGRPGHWSSKTGDTFLIATIEGGQDDGLAADTVIHVALNVTRDRVLMLQLRTTAVILLVAALVAAALAGSAVVRYSLRPVARIAREVAEISPEDLDQRMSMDDRPRELRPLVGAFNTMLDRLARAFAGLSEYSENLAHELRTPLNNLKGEAEVALLHERTAAEYREVLMSSLEEYDRLSTMADGLLFLARAESRATKPVWSVLPVGEHARAVADFYEEIADDKKAILTVEGEASAKIDAVLVRRAIANLVANALAHIGEGGHVRISIGVRAAGGAFLAVADDGSGIAAAHLPHVLERFYRTPETRSRGVTGSGLGLAIVKSIIDLHGGTVEVTSEPERGTTVTLHFPKID